MEISPLSSIEKLRTPLFIVTGANDPRVPASEADQIVKAVRAKGGTAWHLLGTQRRARVCEEGECRTISSGVLSSSGAKRC